MAVPPCQWRTIRQWFPQQWSEKQTAKEEMTGRRRLILARIGTLAFALSGTAHADQYGFNDASIVIAWQVQPAVLIFPADQGTLALDGGQAAP